MPDRRIRVPKGHHEFIQTLLDTSESTGPFRTQADVLAFAAALGARHDQSAEFDETMEPIRPEVFTRQGHDMLINLLAVNKASEAKVLANSEEMEDLRAKVFEEYANAGLSLLRGNLKGELDFTEGLMLLLKREREAEDDESDIDLRDLIKD